MKTLSTLLLLLFTSPLFAQDPASIKVAGQIFWTNVLHTHQNVVTAKTGETWLTLLKTPKGFVLKKVPIAVSLAHEEPYGDGKKITVDAQYGQSIFIVNGVKLQEGKVKFSTRLPYTPLKPGDNIDLNLDEPCALQVRGKVENTEYASNVAITLVCGSKKQILLQRNEYSLQEGIASISWYGDLDGDQKLDFIWNPGIFNTQMDLLYLSSAAKEGELARAVAQFIEIWD